MAFGLFEKKATTYSVRTKEKEMTKYLTEALLGYVLRQGWVHRK